MGVARKGRIYFVSLFASASFASIIDSQSAHQINKCQHKRSKLLIELLLEYRNRSQQIFTVPKMKLITFAAVVGSAVAFTGNPLATISRRQTAISEGYVPDGISPDEWEAQKYRDKHPKHAKHFKSRSLQDFQKDLYAGKVRHQFPVMFAKERVQKHEIHPRDIPYEQRGGSYDNSDVNVGYVPDGMTPHEWHDVQRKERAEQSKKKLAAYGPTSFKSRSLQSFQEDLKAGKVNHLFPEMFAKQKLKRGLIKEEEVPYMQRGGSWDNSDVRGAKKVQWTETDKKYSSGEGPFAFLTGGAQVQTPTVEKEEEKQKKNKWFGLFP